MFDYKHFSWIYKTDGSPPPGHPVGKPWPVSGGKWHAHARPEDPSSPIIEVPAPQEEGVQTVQQGGEKPSKVPSSITDLEVPGALPESSEQVKRMVAAGVLKLDPNNVDHRIAYKKLVIGKRATVPGKYRLLGKVTAQELSEHVKQSKATHDWGFGGGSVEHRGMQLEDEVCRVCRKKRTMVVAGGGVRGSHTKRREFRM